MEENKIEDENILNNIYKIFDDAINDAIDDIYMEAENNILSINDEDKSYFKRTNMDIMLKTEKFCNLIKDKSCIQGKELQEITEEFKDDIYEYMVYFVRKGFKSGFRNAINIMIRDIKNENRNQIKRNTQRK